MEDSPIERFGEDGEDEQRLGPRDEKGEGSSPDLEMS